MYASRSVAERCRAFRGIQGSLDGLLGVRCQFLLQNDQKQAVRYGSFRVRGHRKDGQIDGRKIAVVFNPQTGVAR